MSPTGRFLVQMGASFAVLWGVLRVVLHRRESPPSNRSLMIVGAVVVIGGMLLARYGAQAGLPWWIYYIVPALLTLGVPPVVYRFGQGELARYLVLAFLMAPVIHALFSLFLGWKEYMPFIPIPSLAELWR